MTDGEDGACKCKGRRGGNLPIVRYHLAVVVPDAMVQVQPRSDPRPGPALARRVHPRVVASDGDIPLGHWARC